MFLLEGGEGDWRGGALARLGRGSTHHTKQHSAGVGLVRVRDELGLVSVELLSSESVLSASWLGSGRCLWWVLGGGANSDREH